MMAKVFSRGLFRFLAPLVVVLGASTAGCAEEPSVETSEGVAQSSTDEARRDEALGEARADLDIHLPGTGAVDDRGAVQAPLPLWRDDHVDGGEQDEGLQIGVHGSPGADRSEPDPVPWVPRSAAANDA